MKTRAVVSDENWVTELGTQLKSRIEAKFQRTMARVDEFLGEMARAFDEPETPVVRVAKLQSEQPIKANGKVKPKAGRKSSRNEPNAVTEKALKLKQPFTRMQLANVTHLTPSDASSQLFRWEKWGLIKKTGFGLYERTAKFPGAVEAPAEATRSNGLEVKRVAIPGLDEQSIEERLEKALKDRDAAIQAGKEDVAQMYQDKVDKLQAQLEHK